MRFKLFSMALLMVLAPIGLFAYFSTPVSVADASTDSSAINEGETSGFVYYQDGGNIVCRDASPQEVNGMMRRSPDVRLHQISPIRPNQTGFRIILRGTQQLESFPQAKAAFLRAAAKWEAVIQNPITVVIDVDFGPILFGQPFPANILGGTLREDFPEDYETVRSRLVAGASNEQKRTLYNLLPVGTVPTDLGPATKVSLTTPLRRLLGFLPPVADPINETRAPSTGFNSRFPFDFDPDNGVDADKVDFEYVAIHEIGHTLGFSSNMGEKELKPGSILAPSLWDLFRFRQGVTLSTFSTTTRILSSGGLQAFFSGGPELQLSTGRSNSTGGDGRQASHWKDDDIVSEFIGIMDPTARLGIREVISQNDLMAMDAFGYQIRSAPQSDTTPPTVSVTAPVSGETLTGGSQFTITWDSSDNIGVFRHDIDLSTDEGNSFTTPIVSGVPGNNRSFLWTVPNIEITNARIRVTAFDAANNRGFGVGNRNFSIVRSSDFTLAVTPASQSITAGSSTSFTINAQAIDGFSQPISLSASLSPSDSNITASLSSATLTPGGSASLTVNTTASAPAQSFSISIRGSSGQIVKTATATVNVVRGDFSLLITPASQSVTSGGSTSFTINAQVTAGFSQPISLSASFASPEANGKLTTNLSTATITAGGSATLTVSIDPSATSGSFGIIIRGAAGQLARTATATVNVVASDFQLVFNPAQVSLSQGQAGRFTLNINRSGGFAGNVTVTAPDTKAIKIKIPQPVQSTTGTSVGFDFKVKKKAATGSQQLVFTGRDETGRVRTATLSVVIQ